MRKDQLIIYATNHQGSLYNTVILAATFLIAKHWMYGAPQWTSLFPFWPELNSSPWMAYGAEAAVLAFCLNRFLGQRDYLGKITTGKFKETDTGGMMVKICFNRITYLLPWLILFFMPLKGFLWLHLLGYVFVFAVTALFASASAPVLPLLLFDIGVPAAVAMTVTYLNRGEQEHMYVGGSIALFCVYAFFIGRKIRQSTLQLIDSKYQMAQSAKRADEANRAKSSFLALMSHEIRTPMTGIFGMIDFLRETDLTREQQEFVDTIRDCSKTLLNTLNDILDFSKIESGKLTISKVNFDLHGVLNHSARILREVASDKGLEMIVDINANVPRQMHGDPHRIQQVVMNLINNAVKFTEKGSVEIKAFMIDTEGQRVHIEVRDTGIGISKENMQKLFSAFSQADDSIARKYGGSGLGLSITKNLVKLMGGRIDVNSEEGKGSTFWFELPYQAPIAGAKGEDDDAGAVPDVASQNILVAEDNPVNERIIRRMLAHKGHKVTVVNSGDEAIKAVQEQEYDLIFMDVNMPGRNGFDTTRAIQALGRKYKSIPIIGLSANIMEESVRKCYEAGMVGHVGKPFAPKTLYQTIANFAQKKSGSVPVAAEDPAPEPVTPAAPAPAPTEAPRIRPPKKKSQYIKTMAEVHEAIRDEMGSAYLREMVDGNLVEVARLMEVLQKEFRARNYDEVGKAAHDVKSISGLIGMQRTSQIAAGIENACNNGDTSRLHESIANLEEARAQEGREAERLSREEVPAA